ncbi:MAG: 30S ribosomal protein S9 [Opitutae bacterium]|jgi:small subunit ribosomal protein S9|nr:30S ribosomal protein S9 [Opitutae bacterium]MBT4665178.1 30S ribosomal protein S9 [Opitutae bacterium]MBT5910679.1 30S ribosomal protein S9 [Opitutae bacterium]MBT7742807.1 30S ribosomal protein S9 [Opitutae bacterium]MBT7924808.1 30S ribosomal protein S9 [Opitutae bacterium]
MSAKKQEETHIATGRRKTSTARVRLNAGGGNFIVNGREVNDYFPTSQLRKIVAGPLAEVEMSESIDLIVNVCGGGCTGQAGAVRLGIARALEKMDSELRKTLKKAGHLRRDPRKKERKKPGQPGARKRFQFSKR